MTGFLLLLGCGADAFHAQVLTAARDIALGEELYTTYGGYDISDTTAQRREHLMADYGFHCMCQLCVQSDQDLADAHKKKQPQASATS